MRALYPTDVLAWLETSNPKTTPALSNPRLPPPPDKPKKSGYWTGCSPSSPSQRNKAEARSRSCTNANTKTDFYQSKKVRDGLANKLWDYSSDTADLIDYVRKMPPEQFMTFMLEMGLYELLRGERKLEEVGN